MRYKSTLLLFHGKNCPHFRKLFPEYVEKYNQQQEKEHGTRAPAPSPDTVQEAAATGGKKDHVKICRIRSEKKLKKRVPFWLTVVIVSVFGAVMALPLMQL
ncbi:ubiquitin-conjugating enzyme E2 34-like [Triticum aestivum]|uniref:ubiquitin-conjugating enzyme E2 34-like n=1 Tax=Triticum aestivum TaxID=4565 RepID=UPI001D01B747|nr:ubiquitin-conjugating enzyme E2 34-like [Triticum aestivum]